VAVGGGPKIVGPPGPCVGSLRFGACGPGLTATPRGLAVMGGWIVRGAGNAINGFAGCGASVRGKISWFVGVVAAPVRRTRVEIVRDRGGGGAHVGGWQAQFSRRSGRKQHEIGREKPVYGAASRISEKKRVIHYPTGDSRLEKMMTGGKGNRRRRGLPGTKEENAFRDSRVVGMGMRPAAELGGGSPDCIGIAQNLHCSPGFGAEGTLGMGIFHRSRRKEEKNRL